MLIYTDLNSGVAREKNVLGLENEPSVFPRYLRNWWIGMWNLFRRIQIRMDPHSCVTVARFDII